MRRFFPASLLFFVAAGVAFVLQTIPAIGIFLMFMLAMLWSVALVNAGMIGTAVEALRGRVSRWWLLLPVTFYAGYGAIAVHDHLKLRALSQSFDAFNARVAIPFDPARHALVFEDGSSVGWFTQNHALPVAYKADPHRPEEYLSHRVMSRAICRRVRDNPSLQAAFVQAYGVHDGDAIASWGMDERFCVLSMPERPSLPIVRVSRREQKVFDGLLPVTRATTTVTMPDGRQYRLLGGVAAPLGWIPLPVMGCGLNSGAAKWECDALFWRSGFTPIVSGEGRHHRDSAVLAKALGLKRVASADRRGGDPALVLEKIEKVERETLARQLANVDAMIADPLANVGDWQVGVIANNPDALLSRAQALMTGVERAAAAVGDDRYRARESGRTLARLLADLPDDRFAAFGPRILAVYAAADDDHWLWRTEPMRRLGDLGTAALPHLVRGAASGPSLNGGVIEGLCRVGPAGRPSAEPALLAMWNRSRDGFDRHERAAMFVAMRRIGIPPPPLPLSKDDQLAKLQAEWADISPRSPPSVCAVETERHARSERAADARTRRK